MTFRLVAAPSPVHGTGLFVAHDSPVIERWKRIGTYIGEVITREQANDGRCQAYIYGLGRPNLYVDGNCEANLLRFINHGEGGRANCHGRVYGNKIYFFANRDIMPGEELLCNYGYDPAVFDYVYT